MHPPRPGRWEYPPRGDLCHPPPLSPTPASPGGSVPAPPRLPLSASIGENPWPVRYPAPWGRRGWAHRSAAWIRTVSPAEYTQAQRQRRRVGDGLSPEGCHLAESGVSSPPFRVPVFHVDGTPPDDHDPSDEALPLRRRDDRSGNRPDPPQGSARQVLEETGPALRIINLETSVTLSEDYAPKGIHYRAPREHGGAGSCWNRHLCPDQQPCDGLGRLRASGNPRYPEIRRHSHRRGRWGTAPRPGPRRLGGRTGREGAALRLLHQGHLIPFQIRCFQLRHPSEGDRRWLQRRLHRECVRLGSGVEDRGVGFRLSW